jgi:hypothetical protein
MPIGDRSTFYYSTRLFDSARAFFLVAVRQAGQRDLQESCNAILSIAIALELLAKARLADMDVALIVQGPHRPTGNALAQGAFATISLREAFDKLEKQTAFQLSENQKHLIRALCDLRNRLVHFIAATNKEEVLSIFGASANFFLHLHETEFSAWEEPYQMQPLRDTIVDLTELKSFVSERLEFLSEQLASAERPRTHHLDECSWCLQDASVIEGSEIVCLFCNRRNSIQDVAADLSDDGTVEQCPECKRPAIAKHSHSFGTTDECFCCGHYSGTEMLWSDGTKPIPRLRD